MTTQLPSVSFGALNQGMQVGQNYGLISAEFHLPPERPETPPQPFATISFSRDPDFIDRGDILDQINQRCSEPGARVALVGLGGLGKSQLAIEYAYRLAERPDIWVFWVHAGTQARVEEGFRAIADAVKLPGRNQPKADIPQLVYDWLSNERIGRWLIVLDSADDRDVFYGPTGDDAGNGQPFATYLPQSRNGSILITSRNNDLAFRLTGRRQSIIEVGPMEQTEALALLERKLGSLSDPDVAADLIQVLDLVPLAISQAAAYIQARAPRSSPRKYLTEFRESEHEKSRLPQYDSGDLRRDGGASNAIFTTWQISFDHIRSTWTSAADLLSLMSFFDRQGIPRWVLKPSRTVKDAMWAGYQVEAGGGKTGDGSSAADSDRNDHAGDDLNSAFEDHMAMLRDYYLIVADEVGEEFRMHEVVQLSIRRWLEASGQQETFKKQYIKRMAASFPTGQYENWATCRSLFAHVQAALGYQPSEDMAETWATLLHNGGWYAWSQGRYEIAQQMLGRARKVREKMLGKEDVATLNSISMFAMVLSDQGRWEDAEKLEMQVMETRKTKLGDDHLDTLTSMANLASTYRNQGRWEEAEKLEVQVMETRKIKLGDDHLDTLTSMANLASTYRNQGRWEEAEKLEVQVMETRKTKLGADHPNTLTSMANLASTFWNRGRWNEAESLFMQVMEMSLKVLGLEHPDTLLSMANLASTYRNQGRWKEAESLEVQVIQMRKRVLWPEHPDTLTSMANLASTYRNQGRWKEAESLDVQVMETRKTKLGDHHPDTLTSMANLASTFWNQGRWEEAEKLQVEVMEISKIKLGADHPDTLTSMANLALTFWNQGRWNEVESLEIQVVDMRKRVLGPDHPDTLTSMGNLASTYQNQGRWEEAEMLEVEVMEARMKVLGSEHPSTLTSMANLASTYGDQGRWNKAELLYVQVMETMKRVLGSTHPDTLTSMANLASTYRNQGRWKEAESLDVRVMETRKTKLGPDHPSTLISMGNLASTYRYQNRWEEAEKLEVYVMETSKIKLGADHPDTLTSMANLASTFWNQDRWEEAEKLQVQVMESRKTKLGADHPSTLISMGNLASTFWNQDRWEEAEKLQVQVMETSKIKLGADHPDTLTSMANLASTFWNQDRWEEAEKLQVQVMETSKIKLGADHPDTLTSMVNLALTYRNQGRWEEAKKLEVQAMETRRRPAVEVYRESDGASDGETDIDNIFSESESLALTDSSFSIYGTRYSGVKEVANALLSHPELRSLYATAISRVHEKKCRVHFKGFLKAYAKILKEEATEHLEIMAATFIELMAGRVSDEIQRSIVTPNEAIQLRDGASKRTLEVQLATIKAKRNARRDVNPMRDGNLKRGLPTLDGNLMRDGNPSQDGNPTPDGTSSDALLESVTGLGMEDWTQTENRDDISELEDDRTFELIGDLKEFILSTRPLESLIADMKSWLKVDEQRIETKANPLIRTTADIQVDRDKSDGSGKLDELEATKRDYLLEDPLLLSITDQLQSVNPSQIWESGPQRTTSNQLKGIIEDFFGEPWIWWPLSPRFGEMPVGKTRLHWICGCGRERFAVVPKEFATQAVQSAIGKTHSPSEVTIPLSTHTGSQRINPENNDSMSRAHFSTQFKSQDPSTSQVTYDTQDHPCTQRPKDLHIFFIVASGPKIGDRHRLAQLKVGARTSTDDFFKWLQEQYFKLRGSFRSFLSIRVYSHCDFYMFHKWDVNMYGPAEQNSFPDSNSPYYYLPRPMWPIPPITEDQFYHRFYSCYKPRAFHRPFHKCRKRCSDRTTLDRLPLRQYGFQVEDNKEEHFWGIYAVTRISFARVMVYSVVCFAPAIFPAMVFFFLWLFSWGHEGDLQNAAVPLGLSCALLALFLSFVTWDATSSRGKSPRMKEKED